MGQTAISDGEHAHSIAQWLVRPFLREDEPPPPTPRLTLPPSASPASTHYGTLYAALASARKRGSGYYQRCQTNYHTQPIAQYVRVAAISRTRTRLSSSGSGSRAGHAMACRGAPRFEGGVCAQRTATRLELTLATRRNVAQARA